MTWSWWIHTSSEVAGRLGWGHPDDAGCLWFCYGIIPRMPQQRGVFPWFLPACCWVICLDERSAALEISSERQEKQCKSLLAISMQKKGFLYVIKNKL